MYLTKFITVSVCIAAATATTHQVQVGTNGQRVFTPATIDAKVGDQVQFIFVAGVSSIIILLSCIYWPSKNHTVTSGGGSSSAACQPNGAFNSGFLIGTAGKTSGLPTFTMTVKNTQPITFYCAQNQNDHCQAGMVGVINQSANVSPATSQLYHCLLLILSRMMIQTLWFRSNGQHLRPRLDLVELPKASLAELLAQVAWSRPRDNSVHLASLLDYNCK